ncbi:MAG: glutaredoxin family protein [Sandaracinaceae bacterium]
MASSADLALYLFDGCPYCERVRGTLEELGVTVEERNIHSDPAHRATLVAQRGRATVPVLAIAGADGETFMGESKDIVAYLYATFGEGQEPPFSIEPYAKIALWGLLLGGGLAREPTRSMLWTLACALAAARSGWTAYRTGMWIHGAVAGAFAFGALSIALSALEIADLPWWWAAIGVAGAALIPAMRRKRTAS